MIADHGTRRDRLDATAGVGNTWFGQESRSVSRPSIKHEQFETRWRRAVFAIFREGKGVRTLGSI
jgi:hypothetical protein